MSVSNQTNFIAAVAAVSPISGNKYAALPYVSVLPSDPKPGALRITQNGVSYIAILYYFTGANGVAATDANPTGAAVMIGSSDTGRIPTDAADFIQTLK